MKTGSGPPSRKEKKWKEKNKEKNFKAQLTHLKLGMYVNIGRVFKGTGSFFVDAEDRKNMTFENSNSSHEDDVTKNEKLNGRTHFSCSF